MKPSATSQPDYLEGVIIGGGWAHDELDNPCATVQILVNSHHLTLIDDTAQGWTLIEFDGAPDPEATFHKAFGAVFGDAAEFDEDTLRDFRKALERIGSERFAEICGSKVIPLAIYRNRRNKD